MLISAGRRRVRPPLKSVGLSAVILPVAVYFAYLVFGDYVYVPIAAAVVAASAVVWVRFRGLRAGLPEPYGRGRDSVLDAKQAQRQALLLVLAGAAATIGVLGTVYVLPAVVFFVLVFGLAAGMPFSELLFFAAVRRLESASGSSIYQVSEEVEENGRPLLVKSLRMVRPGGPAPSPPESH